MAKAVPAELQRRVPPGQALTEKLPVLTYGPAPAFDPARWSLRLAGEVEAPVTLDFQQWKSLPRTAQVSDFHCVTTWSRLNNRWEGVRSAELFKLVRPTPDALFVLVYCEGGYTTNLPLADFLDDDVMVADRLDGRDLGIEHGFPARLIVPKLYGWKSAKWVREIEFSRQDKSGFWEVRGYHNHGDPWKEERYSDD